MNIPIPKLVSFTTNGAPAMSSDDAGLIGLLKKVSWFPVFHQQDLMYRSGGFSTCDECYAGYCEFWGLSLFNIGPSEIIRRNWYALRRVYITY
jgi:hypothetical protein